MGATTVDQVGQLWADGAKKGIEEKWKKNTAGKGSTWLKKFCAFAGKGETECSTYAAGKDKFTKKVQAVDTSMMVSHLNASKYVQNVKDGKGSFNG